MSDSVPMSDATTPTVGFTQPEVGASRDSWGAKLNANWMKADQAFAADRAELAALRDRAQALEDRNAALEKEAARASWVGEVRMHSGSIASIANIGGGVWRLCDGQNGTPNLVDRFVVGAGAGRAPGATGGAWSWTGKVVARALQNLRAIGHAISEAQMPWHQHQGRTNDEGEHEHGLPGFVVGQPTAGGLAGSGSGYPSAGNVTHRAGQHGHWFSTDGRGGNQPHDHALPDLSHDHDVTVPIAPPYFALCFVMRVE